MTDLEFQNVWNKSTSTVAVAAILGWSQGGVRCRASQVRRKGKTLRVMMGNVRTMEQLRAMRLVRKPEHKFTSITGSIAGKKCGEIRSWERIIRMKG